MAAKFKLAAVLEFINKAGPGTKSAGKDLDKLAKIAKALGIGLSVAGVKIAAKATYELGVLGAQSLRTKRAFEAISGGALSAADNLNAMRRATRGAMSEQAMMASANQLLQMGLATNAAELEKVTTMATRLGSAMGKEAGPAVAEFSLMLANQSIPRLDTFGISASKVRARILELQAATPGLSREMAFMTATMEEGEAAMGRLGDAVDDELLANERLAASWADLKAMAGEALAPAMADVAEAATGVTSAVLEARREMEGLRAEFGDAAVEAAQTEDILGTLADASAILDGELNAVTGELYDAGSAMESLRQQMHDVESIALGRAFQEVRAEAEGMTPALDAAAGAMGGLATSAKTVAGSFGEMEFDDAQIWKMAMASGASTEALAALAQHLDIATEAEIQRTLEGYRLVEQLGKDAITIEQYAAGMSALETATIDAAGGFEGLGADAAIAEKGLGAMRTAQEQAVAATRDMSAKYGDSEADFAAAEDARLDAIKSARDMRTAEEEAAKATQELKDAQEKATSQTHDLSDEIREVADVSLYRMSEAAVDAELRTLGLREEMGLATTEAYELSEHLTSVNDVLNQMQGEYHVWVYYHYPSGLPSLPPGGGGPPSSSPPPGTPGHQAGTMFHRGGLAIIGEAGPELVAPPRGSRVWPTSAPETRAAVNNRYNYGGDTYNYIINDRLAMALALEQNRRRRIQRIERM